LNKLIEEIYVVTTGLAFLSSLIGFRRDRSLHLNVFSVLLMVTFVIELSVHFNRAKNAWLYNLFILPEFLVYAWFFYRIIHLKTIKRIIVIFFIVYPVFWFLTMYSKYGFLVFNATTIVVGACFTVLLSVSYYYQLLVSEKLVKISRHPEFWIATGMLILYSCQMPFFGLLNFLYENYKSLTTDLIMILQVVNGVMYLLFTYAFLCQLQTKKSS
jgi:hypothetical protein